MSQVRELLEEAKAQRLTRDRIDTLKKPWYTPLWSHVTPLPWVALWIWSPHHSALSIACVTILSLLTIAGVIGEIKARDRTWRQVIEREAPGLHQKLLEKSR